MDNFFQWLAIILALTGNGEVVNDTTENTTPSVESPQPPVATTPPPEEIPITPIATTPPKEDEPPSSDTETPPPIEIPSGETRSFSMGFTPWPYAASDTAITYTYTLVQDSGDIIAHHLMSGIPWEEAYSGLQLPNSIEEDISSKINQTHSGKAIYLSIDSLNSARDDLASNWGKNGEEPRLPPWDEKNFEDPEVAEAYSNFALRMIERFQPIYFNYAPEVSDLILNDPDKFSKFIIFAESVYQSIKNIHPDLPLMASVALKSPDSNETSIIESNFSRLSDFVDVVGISVYPYAFFEHSNKGDPANLPEDWLNQISSIAGGKPTAITETAWIAENLVIPGFGYSEQSNADKQSEYVSTLLKTANDLSMSFVIWFTVVDYDTLWSGMLEQDDLSKIWKDTGLYNEDLNARPALDVWNSYYLREKDI